MRNRFNGLGRILLAGTLLTAGAALGPGQDKSISKPDNIKTNQTDRQAGEPTADQQKNNKPDRETAKEIRKSIQSDKSLSTHAHNVKVIAQNGTVTLKGSVRSDEEKKIIQDKAIAVAGASNVVNDLTIIAADSSKSSK